TLDLSNYRRAGITSFFMRGRLWLDASTAELRRIRWEMAGVHPDLGEPAVLLAGGGHFFRRPYANLLPGRNGLFFSRGRETKRQPVFPMMARTISTYSAFRKFTVTTDETVTTPTGR